MARPEAQQKIQYGVSFQIRRMISSSSLSVGNTEEMSHREIDVSGSCCASNSHCGITSCRAEVNDLGLCGIGKYSSSDKPLKTYLRKFTTDNLIHEYAIYSCFEKRQTIIKLINVSATYKSTIKYVEFCRWQLVLVTFAETKVTCEATYINSYNEKTSS